MTDASAGTQGELAIAVTAPHFKAPRGVPTATAVRLYAAEARIFSNEDLRAAFGNEADTAIAAAAAMVRKNELASFHAGIFHFPSILEDDPRLLAKVAESGATPTARRTLQRRALAAEEDAAEEMRRTANRSNLVERVRRYARTHPVFALSDLRSAKVEGLSATIKRMVEAGELRRLGSLYLRGDIAPLGPEVAAYVAARSDRHAEIQAEIDAFREQFPGKVVDIDAVKFSHWKPTPRPGDGRQRNQRPPIPRINLLVPGYPKIYGEPVRGGGIAWRGTSGLSKLAAAHIAMLVLGREMRFHDLLVEVAADVAPRKIAAKPATDAGSKDGRHHGWDSRDTHMLRPSKTGIGLPEPVIVEVDHREPSFIADGLRAVDNLHVHVVTLDLADYRIRHGDDEMLIERKTTADLISSLTRESGRMQDQVSRLIRSGAKSAVLIEGGLYSDRRIPLADLTRFQARLAGAKGIDVLQTIDQTATVDAIARYVESYLFKGGRRLLRGPGAMLMASGLVNADQAKRLLDAFGTLSGIAAAGPGRISEVAEMDAHAAASLAERIGCATAFLAGGKASS